MQGTWSIDETAKPAGWRLAEKAGISPEDAHALLGNPDFNVEFGADATAPVATGSDTLNILREIRSWSPWPHVGSKKEAQSRGRRISQLRLQRMMARQDDCNGMVQNVSPWELEP